MDVSQSYQADASDVLSDHKYKERKIELPFRANLKACYNSSKDRVDLPKPNQSRAAPRLDLRLLVSKQQTQKENVDSTVKSEQNNSSGPPQQ